MPEFIYDATDASGTRVRARITAASAEQATAQLRRQGYDVAKIEETSGKPGGLFGNFFERLEQASNEFAELQRQQAKGTPLGRVPQKPLTCGWCETVVRPPFTSGDCPNCGGPLPLPPGPDRGPEPPPPPRELPQKFVRKLRWGSVALWIGISFTVIGLVMAPFTFCFTLLFAVIGGLIAWHCWRVASNRLAALQFGEAAPGEITHVGHDRSVEVNGKHPYKVEYRYETGGNWRTGSKSSWNEEVTDHFVGEPVWIVHVPGEKGKSAIWPPLA